MKLAPFVGPRAGWLGKRLDVGWAIDMLHPRARGDAPQSPAR
jgi:hypothetical protein